MHSCTVYDECVIRTRAQPRTRCKQTVIPSCMYACMQTVMHSYLHALAAAIRPLAERQHGVGACSGTPEPTFMDFHGRAEGVWEGNSGLRACCHTPEGLTIHGNEVPKWLKTTLT